MFTKPLSVVLLIALEMDVVLPSSAETVTLDEKRVPSNNHNATNRRNFMTRDAAQSKIDFTLRPHRAFINTHFADGR